MYITDVYMYIIYIYVYIKLCYVYNYTYTQIIHVLYILAIIYYIIYSI